MKRTSKVICAAVASVPVLLAFTRNAHATATWIGTTGSWGDATQWAGNAPIPPGASVAATNGAAQGDAYIGNNGTVLYNNFLPPGSVAGNFNVIGRLHLGYSGSGAPNSGDGTLVMDSGSLATQQFNTIGDGANGTLIINGGTVDFHGTDNTKDTMIGYTGNGTILLSSGSLITAQYGLEQGAGFSALLMSGGVLQLGAVGGSRAEQGVTVDYFSFSGGQLLQVEDTVINDVSNSGSITFDGNGAGILRFDIKGNDTWGGSAGPIGAAAGVGALSKTGPGTLTLTGTQNYTRGTVVNGGTLILDYSINPSIINSAGTIGLGGGTLKFQGNSSGQAVSKTTILVGGSTVVADPNSGGATSLSIGSITRTLGGTLNVVPTSGVLGTDVLLGTTTSPGTSGIFPWGTVNGTDWLTAQGGVLKAFSAYVDASGTGLVDGTQNYQLTSGTTAISAAATANSLKLSGNAGLDMTGGGSLVLTSGGLLANTTGSILGGQLTADTTAGTSDLIVTTPTDLTISSAITDNTQGVSLTKTGAGVLTISGTNTYSGNTFVNGGTLKLGSTSALRNNAVVVMSDTAGAVLDLNGNNTTLAAITGTATFTVVRSTGSPQQLLTAAGGEVKLTNANLTITNSGANTYYGGVISGNGNLAITSGDATLTNTASTFTGSTTISGGASLTVTNLADGGANSSMGSSSSAASNLTLDNGTLRFESRVSGATNRQFTLGTGGGTIESFGFNGTGHRGAWGTIRFTNPGAITLTGNGSRTLTLAGSSGTFSTSVSGASVMENGFAAIIPDAPDGSPTNLTLQVTRQIGAQWDLSASSTYTGNTTINGGTLSVNFLANGGQPSPIGKSSNDASHLTINASGGPTALQYTGTGGSTDRLFSFNNGGSGTLLPSIAANGTGPLVFTNPGALGGGGPLQLTGSNTGNNTLTPAITGGASLVKGGTGLWIVNGNNSYTGPTTLSGGTLSVGSIADAGANSSIGAANSGPDDLTFSGGALRYTGGAASTNRLFSMAGSGTIDSSGTGPINFNNTGVIDRPNTVNETLGLAGTNTGANTIAGTLNDPPASTVSFTGSVTKSGTGTWILSGSNTYTGPTTVTGGTLVLTSAAQAPVTTNAGGAVLNAGTLVLDYTGGTDPNASSAIVSVLATNLANNNTQGQYRTGNTADPNRGIGYKDDTTNSQFILRYTYRGDANLDGKVNLLDFNALATNFGGTSDNWVQGDFNYDGKVNTSDFMYLSANYNAAQLAAPALDVPVSLGALVPEPASGLVALLGGAALLRRSRRGRREA